MADQSRRRKAAGAENAGARPKRLRLAAFPATAAAAAIAAAAATFGFSPRPLLVWNASASSPLGLYLLYAPSPPNPGETVIAWAPAGARRLAAARGYLPARVPLVKRVAAAAGDRVCARGDAVSVNGSVTAFRRPRDPSGRPLPWWSGCALLRRGDLFLLSDAPAAFDGRYFGITHARDVIGRARLIWAA
jgi:conjugative transfer signal peptidase TraF